MRETKFCTTCQSTQPVEGGYKKPGSFRGWACKSCFNKTNKSIYAGSYKTTAKSLARLNAAMGRRND